MFCTNCGTGIFKTDKFCTACGFPVANDAEQTAARPDSFTSPLYVENHIPSWGGDTMDDAAAQPSTPPQPPPTMSSSHPEQDFDATSNAYGSSFNATSNTYGPSFDATLNTYGPPFDATSNIYEPPFDGYHTNSHDASFGGYRTKKDPTKIIIPIIIVVAALLIGVVIYWFLGPSGGDIADPPPPPVVAVQADEPEIYIAPTPPPVPEAEVLSINIVHEGMYVWDLIISEGEFFYLYAAIEPFGIDTDISWASSNTNIFRVDAATNDGTEALLTGISAGEAVLIVTAGNVVQTITVWVYLDDSYWDDFGDWYIDEGFSIDILASSINQPDLGVQIAMFWDYPRHGSMSIFVREPNSTIWMMHSRDGDYRQVNPTFGYDGHVFTIGFPTTERIYYLYNDGTGNFRRPDWTNNEDLTWYFWTFTY